MDLLDQILPFYVEYLGSFESDKKEKVSTALDALNALLKSGVQKKVFIKNAEISFSDDLLILTNVDKRSVKKFSLNTVKDPVSFKKRTSGAFDKVVIFTEVGGGHFNNDVFHAFQCTDSDPDELVEAIRSPPKPIDDYLETPVLRQKNHSRNGSRVSDDGTLRGSIMSSFNGTDSVRSATIRRNGNGGRPRSSMQVFEQGPMPGVPPPEVIPVVMPTPPSSRQKENRKDGNENGTYKPPLVAKLSNKLSSGPGSLEPNHRFQYNATDDYAKKDSILLNCCIEDIERFCEKIKTVPKSPINHKMNGDATNYDNALSENDQYKATDFVSVFQKFKLAFNLLARLDGYIKDPPARELIYFLFPPLARILDESHELFGVDLVRDIVSPLPTRRAIKMMNSCLRDREKGLWKALGDYWLHPKSKWEGDIPPYKLIFSDGWAPGVIDFPEDDEDDLSQVTDYNLVKELLKPKSFSPPANSPKENKQMPQRVRRMERQTSVLSDRTITSWGSGNSDNVSAIVSTDYQNEYRDELMDRRLNIALVTHTRERKHNQELSIVKGEYLELLDASRNWWKCRNITNEVGYVPCTLLRKILFEQGSPLMNENSMHSKPDRNMGSSNPQHASNGSRNYNVREMNNRNSRNIENFQPNGRRGRRDSSSNDSSSTLSGGDQTPALQTQYSREHVRNDGMQRRPKSPPRVTRGSSPPSNRVSSAPVAPPPPPPMMVPPPPMKTSPLDQLMAHKNKYANLSKNDSVRSRTDSVYSAMSVQDELKNVLEIFREKDNQLDIPKTPELFISQDSKPSEVRKWLKAKNFSQRALDQFKNVDGKKLLSLKRTELISAFGKVEGSRLDGQLQISRKKHGYGTASSELRNVLAKAKKRADEERRESIRQAYTDNDFQSAA